MAIFNSYVKLPEGRAILQMFWQQLEFGYYQPLQGWRASFLHAVVLIGGPGKYQKMDRF